MIKPTVGRVVLYHPHGQTDSAWLSPGDQPLAALVAYVWNERLVNLVVFTANGVPLGKTSVRLLQDDDKPYEGSAYCEWMPYQKIQNEKTQELAKLV